MLSIFLKNNFSYHLKTLKINEIYEIIETGKLHIDHQLLAQLKAKDSYAYNQWLVALSSIYAGFEETEAGDITLDLSSTEKGNLPTVIFNTTHDTGNKETGVEWNEPSQKLVVDLDIKNIPLEQLKGNHQSHEMLTVAIFEAIQASQDRLSGLLMGWVSPSKKGIKLVYNVDITHVSQLVTFQQRAIEDINELIRFRLDQFDKVVDTSSNSAKQQCYISKSEYRFFNNSALYLSDKKSVYKKVVVKNPEKKVAELEKAELSGYSPTDQVYKSGFDSAIVRYIYRLAGVGFPQDYIEKACVKWYNYPDNTSHGNRIVYSKKIPKKISESVKGIMPKLNVGITNDATSDEQQLFTHWWAIDSRNNIQISQAKLETALKEHGFTYIKEDVNKKMYVNRNNVLSLLGTRNEDITDYLHRSFFDIYLKDVNGNYVDRHEEIITKSKNLFLSNKDKFWIDTLPLNQLDKEDKITIKLHLANGVVHITKDKVELVEYSKMDRPVFEEQLIKHWNNDDSFIASYRICDWEKHDMVKVLRNICENRDDKFDYLCSLLGYLISSYKTQGNNKIVMLMDGFKPDQNQIGGTGKSMVGRFISLLRKTDRMHTAKEGRFENQTVTLGTQVLYMEDLKFTNKSITELRNFNDTYLKIEEKGKMPVVLEGYNCPRLLITTNYVTDSDADADTRRYYLFCIADHYSKSYTVKDDIGYELFNDFTQSDWDSWLNFMVHCCQLYLKNGVMYVDETHKLKAKRNAQSMNNIHIEELVDYIIDRCDEVRNLNVPHHFKLSSLMSQFPKVQMGKHRMNDLIEEVVRGEGLDYDRQAKDKGKRVNRISLPFEELVSKGQMLCTEDLEF